MKKIHLGNTKLEISTEGFGAMGMSEFYGDSDEINNKVVLTRALELGVNMIDTADIYGYGHNEKFIGEILSKVQNRSDIILATKCGIVRDEHDATKRGVNNNPEYIRQCCDNSIERLNTYIDLYYLHRTVDEKSIIKSAMETLAELLAEGKIKAVGLSEVSEEYIRYAQKCLLEATEGKHGISAVQTEYSLMSRGVEDNGVLKTCRELGITFVAYSPIGRGLLTGKIESAENLEDNDFRKLLPRFQEENMKHNRMMIDALNKFAESKKCSLSQLALSWLINQGIVPIPGTRRINYLESNVAASDIILSEAEIKIINSITDEYVIKGLRYPEQAMKAYGLKS